MSSAQLGFLKLVGSLLAGALIVGAVAVLTGGWRSAPYGAVAGAAGALYGVRQVIRDHRANNADRRPKDHD